MHLSRTRASLAAAAMFAVLATAGGAEAVTVPPATDLISIDSPLTYSFETGLAAQYITTSAPSKLHADQRCNVPVPPKTDCPPPLSTCLESVTLLNNTTSACFDLAATDRSPHTGGTDWFIPFGREAVGWSASTGGHAPMSLTTADLTGIYSCAITQWSQITDIAGYSGPKTTIKVYLPPPVSSTRSEFLAILGLTGTSEPCWQTTTPAENEGTDPVFTGNPDAIFPYSLSHYVSQVYNGHGTSTEQPGSLDAVRSVDGWYQIDTTARVWNPNLPTMYIRTVYHVVRQTDWADAVEGPRLKRLLSSVGIGGYVCTYGTAEIASYGFRPLTAGCGTIVGGS